MTAINYFDGRETGNNGFYNQPFDAVFVNAYLDDIDHKKVLYHELGHVGQYLANYQRLKEKFEAEADRVMIKNLLKDYLQELEHPKQFNVYRFMKHNRLKTLKDEVIALEEFRKLCSEVQ